MNLTLTQSNAAALARYANLVGVSPEEFLQEFLVARFSDPQSGEAEPFLCGFRFSDEVSRYR